MKKFIVLLLLSFVFNFAQAMPQRDNDVGVKTTSIHKTKDNVVSPVFNADINVISVNKLSTLKNDTIVNNNGDKFIVVAYFTETDTIVNYELNRIRCYNQKNHNFAKQIKCIYVNKSKLKITGSSGGLPLMQ